MTARRRCMPLADRLLISTALFTMAYVAQVAIEGLAR